MYSVNDFTQKMTHKLFLTRYVTHRLDVSVEPLCPKIWELFRGLLISCIVLLFVLSSRSKWKLLVIVVNPTFNDKFKTLFYLKNCSKFLVNQILTWTFLLPCWAPVYYFWFSILQIIMGFKKMHLEDEANAWVVRFCR